MADILWEKVVGSKTVSDGGYFGDLLTIARAHVDDAVKANRLTSAQAGEIYTAMIPAAMQQSMQFELSEALTEAQIADALAKTEIAQKESELNQAVLSLQADKLVSDTDIAERQMVETELTGALQRDLINEEIETANKQQILLDTEEQAKQYEVDNILPANLSKLQKDIDVTERGMLEAESTGIKQRILLDTEEEAKQFEVDNLLPKQLNKLNEEITIIKAQESKIYTDMSISERQMVEAESTGAKQRILLDEEKDTADLNQMLLNKESDIKEIQAVKLSKDIELSERQVFDTEQTSIKQRVLLDEQLITVRHDLSIKERTMVLQEEENLRQLALLEEQLVKVQEEIDLLETEDLIKTYQRENTLPAELVNLQKQKDVLEVDIETKQRQIEITERESNKKIEILAEELDIAKIKADKEYSDAKAAIEKINGHDYLRNVDLSIQRATLENTGTGKLDLELDFTNQKIVRRTN